MVSPHVPEPFEYYTDDEADSKGDWATDEEPDIDVDEGDMAALRMPESEFRIAVREINGQPEICGDCFSLVLHLQQRVPRRSMSWKSIPQLLFMGAYRDCRLCEMVASAPGLYLDDADLDDKFPLKPLREYERLFTEEFLDLAIEQYTPGVHPIEVFGHVNGVERICEVSFTFEFQTRSARVLLAIWLEPMPEAKFDPLRRFHNPQPERCEGVRTGSDITWREPLRQNQSWRTFELFESWISTCLLDHPQCSDTLSGRTIDNLWREDGLGRTELPSRVLDVLENGSVVKLVETRAQGRSGAPYVTLSHCWGPPDKRPISTTRSNLQEHIATGISVSSLPKTFRDAVRITRQLDIRYLWIDSLCIVQDDEADWLAESKKMGAIYHHAALTIAASDAQNSTEGCFVAKRRGVPGYGTTTAKFQMMRGEEGDAFKTCFSHVPVSPRSEPYFSPLGHRAWACQEWYLSRRVIFCTRAGFAWKCRRAQHNERGRYLDMHEQFEWEHLMERYSESQLTRETDRLIAVSGIANLLGETKDRRGQGYHFGHWIGGDDTAIMLCWMMKEYVSELDGKGPSDMPSWSWASIAGAKLFWRTQYQFFHPCRNLLGPGDISISPPDGTVLHIKWGQARKIQARLLDDDELERHPALTDRQVWSPEALFISLRRERTHAPIHVILGDDIPQDAGFQNQAIGLAAFDRVQGPVDSRREIYALPVVESPRFALDPFLPKGADTLWYGKDVGAQRKMAFMDLGNPDADGSIRCYAADELKGRPTTKYSVITDAGNGITNPVGLYTHPSPEEHKSENDPNAQYVYDGYGKSIYWAILVEPGVDAAGVDSGSFRRVGMALVGNEKWMGEAKPQDMKLV